MLAAGRTSSSRASPPGETGTCELACQVSRGSDAVAGCREDELHQGYSPRGDDGILHCMLYMRARGAQVGTHRHSMYHVQHLHSNASCVLCMLARPNGGVMSAFVLPVPSLSCAWRTATCSCKAIQAGCTTRNCKLVITGAGVTSVFLLPVFAGHSGG